MNFHEWWESIPNDVPMKKDAAKNRHIKAIALAAWQAAQQEWQPIETAPKDGTLFLGNFGYPWAILAAWNEPSEEYCVAELQIGLYHGKWNDTYFETDHLPEKDLLGWLPMPEIPGNKK